MLLPPHLRTTNLTFGLSRPGKWRPARALRRFSTLGNDLSKSTGTLGSKAKENHLPDLRFHIGASPTTCWNPRALVRPEVVTTSTTARSCKQDPRGSEQPIRTPDQLQQQPISTQPAQDLRGCTSVLSWGVFSYEDAQKHGRYTEAPGSTTVPPMSEGHEAPANSQIYEAP
jgi:hypothetical protein